MPLVAEAEGSMAAWTASCTHLCIDHCEPNRHGQIDVGLQEGNDLSAAAWGCHHQHILQQSSTSSMCSHKEQLQGCKEQGTLNSKCSAVEQRKLRHSICTANGVRCRARAHPESDDGRTCQGGGYAPGSNRFCNQL